MTTVLVADKPYVDATLAQSVVSGVVNGAGHIIFTRGNGSTFDGGDFNTAITTLINSALATANFLNILISASAAGNVALKTKGFAGQTADLQQWLNSASAVLGKVKADGTFAVTLNGSTIDGAVNTMPNINAAKVNGRKVTADDVAPATPVAGDIWIKLPAGV